VAFRALICALVRVPVRTIGAVVEAIKFVPSLVKTLPKVPAVDG
jgi:hypothetical protein